MRVFQRLRLSLYVRHARLRLRLTGIDRLIADAPQGARDYNPVEMWWLYRDVGLRRPTHLIELGCGRSTLVMLRALAEAGAGYLVSYDANRDWAAYWRSRIPAGLAKYGRIDVAPIEVTQQIGAPAHRYRIEPPPRIDFLFVDGPSPKDVPGWMGQPVAADPILWSGRFSDGARIVIEGREQNVTLLRACMPGFVARAHPPLRWTTLDRGPLRPEHNDAEA